LLIPPPVSISEQWCGRYLNPVVMVKSDENTGGGGAEQNNSKGKTERIILSIVNQYNLIF